MCDPCKSDRDCAVGAVCTGEVLGNYNTEKFCTKPVGSCSECRTWFDLLPAGDLKSNMLGYGCVKPGSEFDFPPNQCIGLVQLGTDNSNEPVSVFGCYTPGKL
jgi:hypothetical protein